MTHRYGTGDSAKRKSPFCFFHHGDIFFVNQQCSEIKKNENGHKLYHVYLNVGHDVIILLADKTNSNRNVERVTRRYSVLFDWLQNMLIYP